MDDIKDSGLFSFYFQVLPCPMALFSHSLWRCISKIKISSALCHKFENDQLSYATLTHFFQVTNQTLRQSKQTKKNWKRVIKKFASSHRNVASVSKNHWNYTLSIETSRKKIFGFQRKNISSPLRNMEMISIPRLYFYNNIL